MRLFGDACWAKGFSSNTLVLLMMPTVIDQVISNTLRIYFFQSKARQNVQERGLEPYVLDWIARRSIDAPAVSLPLEAFVKQHV